MNSSTQRIALLAVGIALFVALSMCLQVPVFENYYLCLGYVVMAVYCYSFGTVSGTIAGTLGVVLYCLVINGLRGMPGWAGAWQHCDWTGPWPDIPENETDEQSGLENSVQHRRDRNRRRRGNSGRQIHHGKHTVRSAVRGAGREEYLCVRGGPGSADHQPSDLYDAG